MRSQLARELQRSWLGIELIRSPIICGPKSGLWTLWPRLSQIFSSFPGLSDCSIPGCREYIIWSHFCLYFYSDRNSHHLTTGSRLSSCLTGTSRFYALTKSMESKIACVILIVIGFCLFTLCLFLAGCKIRLIESVIEAYTRSSEEETKPKTVFIEETAI